MATKTLDERASVLAPVGLTPLLDQTQLMARYGVSDWTVQNWVRQGCPTEPTRLRGPRFDLAKVEAWMAEAPAGAA